MMCYAGFILIQKLFSHQHLADGIASVIFLISGLFSVLFLFLAIISEYISRILIETKNRPLYNISQDITHEDLNPIDA
jgi:dolichol-phosphate mannosyltransferase